MHPYIIIIIIIIMKIQVQKQNYVTYPIIFVWLIFDFVEISGNIG